MPDTEKYVLAIDLGTSGPKAAVVGVDGVIRATGRARVETLYVEGGGIEHDPTSVWRSAVCALHP